MNTNTREQLLSKDPIGAFEKIKEEIKEKNDEELAILYEKWEELSL